MKPDVQNKTFGIANKYILFGLIVIASVSIAVSGQISEAFVDYFHGDGSNITGIVQPNTVIYKTGSTIYAKNGTTGAIDASGTSFSSVVTSALTNGSVKIKDGNYVATSVIDIPAGRTVEGESWNTQIQAGGGSGNSIFNMSSFTAIKNIEFVNTSVNDIPIIIPASGIDQRIDNVYFYDFKNTNVLFNSDNAGAGAILSNNYFTTKDTTKYAIYLPNDTLCCGGRQIVDNQAGGYNLVDLNGSQNTIVSGNLMVNMKFRNDTVKAIVTSNRLSTVGQEVQLNGTSNVFTSNIVAGRIHLYNVTDTHVADNVQATGESIDSSSVYGLAGYKNYIEQHDVAYTPAWTAVTVNPTLGSGTLVGSYNRMGNVVTATVDLTIAADTNTGTGGWQFSLPYTASSTISGRRWEGSGYLLDSGTGFYTASSTVGSGQSIAVVYAGNNSADAVKSTVPITWATGDELHVTITYFV